MPLSRRRKRLIFRVKTGSFPPISTSNIARTPAAISTFYSLCHISGPVSQLGRVTNSMKFTDAMVFRMATIKGGQADPTIDMVSAPTPHSNYHKRSLASQLISEEMKLTGTLVLGAENWCLFGLRWASYLLPLYCQKPQQPHPHHNLQDVNSPTT